MNLNPCVKCGGSPLIGFADSFGNNDGKHWGVGHRCNLEMLSVDDAAVPFNHTKDAAIEAWNAANPLPGDTSDPKDARIAELEERIADMEALKPWRNLKRLGNKNTLRAVYNAIEGLRSAEHSNLCDTTDLIDVLVKMWDHEWPMDTDKPRLGKRKTLRELSEWLTESRHTAVYDLRLDLLDKINEMMSGGKDD